MRHFRELFEKGFVNDNAKIVLFTVLGLFTRYIKLSLLLTLGIVKKPYCFIAKLKYLKTCHKMFIAFRSVQ